MKRSYLEFNNLRYIFLFICFIVTPIIGNGQLISVNGKYSLTGEEIFNNNLGYGVEYRHQIMTRSRAGVAFEHHFNKMAYNQIDQLYWTPDSYNFSRVTPNNHRYSIKMNYTFDILKNSCSSLYIGPELGLNYFKVDEETLRLPSGGLGELAYNELFRKNNKLSIGFLMEFEEMINKRTSIYSSISSEFTSFEKFGLDGAYYPFLMAWLNFGIGIRYSFIK
ncbi:MAG: hypothetical protein ACERKD_21745 [Prolixibacteraceae bacterium]